MTDPSSAAATITADQSEVFELLADPRTHAVLFPVTRIDTHSAVVFLADLARRVTVPTLVDFVAVTPFDGVSGRTRVVKDLDQSVTGRPVVLVTGIVDTGLTADFLHRHLQGARPSSVRVATLADRSARRLLPLQPDYRALEVPDRFLIGYGLDHRGRYRNVPSLWGVHAADLAEDPDRYVSVLYGADPSAGPGR